MSYTPNALGKLWAAISSEYSNTRVYLTDEYCRYEGAFYKCKEDFTAAHDWNADDWNEVTIASQFGGSAAMDWSPLVKAYSSTETYKLGEYVMVEGKVYRCKTAIETAETFNPAKWDGPLSFADEIDVNIDPAKLPLTCTERKAMLNPFYNGSKIAREKINSWLYVPAIGKNSIMPNSSDPAAAQSGLNIVGTVKTIDMGGGKLADSATSEVDIGYSYDAIHSALGNNTHVAIKKKVENPDSSLTTTAVEFKSNEISIYDQNVTGSDIDSIIKYAAIPSRLLINNKSYMTRDSIAAEPDMDAMGSSAGSTIDFIDSLNNAKTPFTALNHENFAISSTYDNTKNRLADNGVTWSEFVKPSNFTNVAEYSNTATYVVGDMVKWYGEYYRAKEDIPVNEYPFKFTDAVPTTETYSDKWQKVALEDDTSDRIKALAAALGFNEVWYKADDGSLKVKYELIH